MHLFKFKIDTFVEYADYMGLAFRLNVPFWSRFGR